MNNKPKKRKTLYELFFKRFIDIFFSLLFIILFSPILITIWITLKIAYRGKVIGGHVILRQYRPGKNGKVFLFYKFKSMTDEMDENGNLLPDSKRLTKIGKFIRKTSLDELPQLFNILKGEMSFIGPRPRLIKDMVFYDEDVIKAYSITPGLSGPSQVNGGRSSASWEEIFKWDADYANNISLFKDISILFKTIIALFKSDSGSNGDSVRDYYYSDYLLRTGKITKEQYDLGIIKAKEFAKNGGVICYDAKLHNNENLDNISKPVENSNNTTD